MTIRVKGTSGTGFLSNNVTEDGLTKIHGVAIGSGDVTRGHLSGERKLWTSEVLEAAANTLQGKQIVVDHENRSAREVVGKVTEARFEEGKGVIYQGVVDDEELASKIGHGWLEVSPRIIHSKEMEDRGDVKVPQSIRKFDNLSVVSRGASPSNSVDLGENDELSAEELQSAFEDNDDCIEEMQHRIDEGDELAERDLTKWMYDDQNAAQGAAEDLGCSGYHEHDFEGEKKYVPCDTHDQFLRSLNAKEEENMEDDSETDEDLTEENQEVENGELIENLSSMWGMDEDRVKTVLELGKEDNLDEILDAVEEENSADVDNSSDDSQNASKFRKMPEVLGMK